MIRQLALPFAADPVFHAADFLQAGSNAQARAWLEAPARWPGGRLALFGEAGSGKTHLLHVFAQARGAALLPCGAVRGLLDVAAIAQAGALAIDDADAAPEPVALLHLINLAAERGVALLLAGRAPPARWGVTLPDLASRLRATSAVGLGQPDDGLLQALLAQLLARRQLRVEARVQAYLLARLPRTGAAIRAAVACLDRISLQAGAPVSRAVAADVLSMLGDGADDDLMSLPDEASHDAPRLF